MERQVYRKYYIYNGQSLLLVWIKLDYYSNFSDPERLLKYLCLKDASVYMPVRMYTDLPFIPYELHSFSKNGIISPPPIPWK